MKSYLSLIPISAKIHRQKHRMTQICIFLAVLLVTGIFSMADMEVRSQKISAIKKYGNWHICLRNLTEEEAELIALRPEVEISAWYNSLNYRLKEEYTLDGKKACICGMDEAILTDIMAKGLVEGTFPEKEGEVLLLENARDALGVKTGDTVVLKTPSGGEMSYRISGFAETEALVAKMDAIVLCLPVEAFKELYRQEAKEEISDIDMCYYVRMKEHSNLRKAIEDIKMQYHFAEEDVGENTMVLGLAGASEDAAMQALYMVALVLFLLVLLAGTLMIASSMNSNIAQRTSFFGMLRCIGADKKQTMRFVRLEALYWCRTAILAGVSAGVVITWLMCAILRFLSEEFFAEMPVIGISGAGIIMGVLTGLLTVFIAARSPAKKASEVSPLTAVSGNIWNRQAMKKAANTKVLKIDTALGIHHARQNKKNFVLMTGSFAISIILFLSFSLLLDFMGHAITPLRPYTSDFSIISAGEQCEVPKSLVQEIYQTDGVKRVYGRQFAYDIAVESATGEKNVMLISYEALQFNWADEEKWVSDKRGLERVAKDTEEGMVLAVYSGNNLWEQGEKVKTELGELTIAGFLEHCPFEGPTGTEIFVCSEELFTKLTGETDYTIIDIQVERGFKEDAVAALRNLAGKEFLFSDNRLSNQSAKGAYYSLAVFIYGFLAIITMIAAFNIINSIAMSASAHMKEYGAMRAAGMDMKQVRRMISAETYTYAISGIIAGTLFGLPLHGYLWDRMIYVRWNDAWEMPAAEIFIIILLVAVSCMIAVKGPAKQIGDMDIVEVIADY